MLPSFQAPSRQEGIKWTTTRYHHPSTVFNGVYPANVAGVLLITPRLCKGRDSTAWIRSRWSKTFNAHHWIRLVWWRSTRWDLLWQHWLSSLMQELNIMYQRIAWATWGWSTKVRGWTCKTGCVIISPLHHGHNQTSVRDVACKCKQRYKKTNDQEISYSQLTNRKEKTTLLRKMSRISKPASPSPRIVEWLHKNRYQKISMVQACKNFTQITLRTNYIWAAWEQGHIENSKILNNFNTRN